MFTNKVSQKYRPRISFVRAHPGRPLYNGHRVIVWIINEFKSSLEEKVFKQLLKQLLRRLCIVIYVILYTFLRNIMMSTYRNDVGKNQYTPQIWKSFGNSYIYNFLFILLVYLYCLKYIWVVFIMYYWYWCTIYIWR